MLGQVALKKKYITFKKMSEIKLEFKPESKPEMEPVTEPLKAVTEAVTTTLKRAYTMSDLKKEQLAKARARALELRTALNAIKEPKPKPVKVKPPSKLEIEISEIKKQTKPPEAVAPKEPEPVAPKEPVSPPVAHRAPVAPKEPEVVVVPKLIKKIRLLPEPPVQPPQKKQFQRDKVSGFFYL
jgi:hypothetical protein